MSGTFLFPWIHFKVLLPLMCKVVGKYERHGEDDVQKTTHQTHNIRSIAWILISKPIWTHCKNLLQTNCKCGWESFVVSKQGSWQIPANSLGWDLVYLMCPHCVPHLTQHEGGLPLYPGFVWKQTQKRRKCFHTQSSCRLCKMRIKLWVFTVRRQLNIYAQLSRRPVGH